MSSLLKRWLGAAETDPRAVKIRDGKSSDLESGPPDYTKANNDGWALFGVERRRTPHVDEEAVQEPLHDSSTDSSSESEESSSSSSSTEDPSLLVNVLNISMLADDCIWVCFQDGQSLVFAGAGSAYAYYLKKADRMTEDLIYTEYGSGTYCFSDGVRKEVSLPKTPRSVLHYAAAQGVKYKEFMRSHNVFEMFARRASTGVLYTSSSEASSSSDYSQEEEEEEFEAFTPEIAETERQRLESIQPPVASGVESGSTARRRRRRQTRKARVLNKYAYSLRRDDKLFGKHPVERVREPALDLRRVQYGSFVVTTYEEWFRWTSHVALSISDALFMAALRDWYKEGELDRRYTKPFQLYLDETFPDRPDLEGSDDTEETSTSHGITMAPDALADDLVMPLPFFGRSTGTKRDRVRGGADIGLEASRTITHMLCNEFDHHYPSINLMYQCMQNVCTQSRLLVLETNERYRAKVMPRNPRVDAGELEKLETCLEELSSALRGWTDFTLQDPEKRQEAAREQRI